MRPNKEAVILMLHSWYHSAEYACALVIFSMCSACSLLTFTFFQTFSFGVGAVIAESPSKVDLLSDVEEHAGDVEEQAGEDKGLQSLFLITVVNWTALLFASKLVQNCLIRSSVSVLNLEGHARNFFHFSILRAHSSAFRFPYAWCTN